MLHTSIKKIRITHHFNPEIRIKTRPETSVPYRSNIRNEHRKPISKPPPALSRTNPNLNMLLIYLENIKIHPML